MAYEVDSTSALLRWMDLSLSTLELDRGIAKGNAPYKTPVLLRALTSSSSMAAAASLAHDPFGLHPKPSLSQFSSCSIHRRCGTCGSTQQTQEKQQGCSRSSGTCGTCGQAAHEHEANTEIGKGGFVRDGFGLPGPLAPPKHPRSDQFN